MKILGIETSCDESAAAVVEDGQRLLANVVASQADLHARYGGVVPEVASRQHLRSIVPTVDVAMEEAGCGWSDLEAIAVTVGPGIGRLSSGGGEFRQGDGLLPWTAVCGCQPSRGPHLRKLADGRGATVFPLCA